MFQTNKIMRKNIFKLLLAVVMVGTLHSCKKEEGLVEFATLETGSYLKLKEKVNDIMDATLPASKVEIKVTEYGAPVDNIKIYVNAGSKTANKSKWKAIKEVPYNGETTLSVTNAEITAAIGGPVQPGVTYWLFNEVITKDGRTFSLANTYGEIEANPNYNMALTWRAVAVCPFNASAAVGTYTITTDSWDGAVGEKAEVTATANSITVNLLFPYAANPGLNPVKVDITPLSGAATVAKQVYGSYGAGFTNFTCRGSGFVFSCTGTIDLSLTHELGSTNYGTYRIVLKK